MTFLTRSAAAAVSLIFLSLGVYAQTTRVVPARRTTVVGNTYSLEPFGWNAGRFQQLIEGASVCKTVAILDEIAFRPTLVLGNSVPFSGRRIPNFTVWLGSSPVSRSAMSRRFATNRGTRTVVHTGTYNLPTIRLGPSPAKWDIRLKLARRIVYTRNAGNLLLEIEFPGVRTTLDISFVDADVGVGGKEQVFGASGRFRQGEAMFVFSDPVTLRVGGTAYLGMTIVPALPTIPLALGAYGLSKSRYGSLKLPFDLGSVGAAGNKLYVSLDIMQPIVLSRFPLNVALIGQTSVPLPNNPSLAGMKLYGQCMTIHPASNSLGIVFSDAIEMLIGKDVPAVTRSLYASDSSATIGNFGFGLKYRDGGPILRLSGAFR